MLLSILIMLAVGGFLVMILSVLWKSYVLSTLSMILYLVCSIGIIDVEIPYTAIQSDNTIVTGIQTVSTNHPLIWVFIAFALLMFLYTWVLVFEDFIKPGLEKKKML